MPPRVTWWRGTLAYGAASGSDRQKTYRRGRAGKSVDVAGATHALLAQLCQLEGASIDATLRSLLARALEERNDRDLLEAAWGYLNASRAVLAEFHQTDAVTERLANCLADAGHAFNEAVSREGKVSQQTQRRVNWLIEQGKTRVDEVVANSVVVEPLAADARHGTLSDTAQTLLAGGCQTTSGTHPACCLKSHCYRALPCRHSRSFR